MRVSAGKTLLQLLENKSLVVKESVNLSIYTFLPLKGDEEEEELKV